MWNVQHEMLHIQGGVQAHRTEQNASEWYQQEFFFGRARTEEAKGIRDNGQKR